MQTNETNPIISQVTVGGSGLEALSAAGFKIGRPPSRPAAFVRCLTSRRAGGRMIVRAERPSSIVPPRTGIGEKGTGDIDQLPSARRSAPTRQGIKRTIPPWRQQPQRRGGCGSVCWRRLWRSGCSRAREVGERGRAGGPCQCGFDRGVVRSLRPPELHRRPDLSIMQPCGSGQNGYASLMRLAAL
jgi:hypothetical protein